MARVRGMRSSAQYIGRKKSGQRWPGPITYQGRTKVASRAARADQRLALRARHEIGAHHRRGLRHAEIDEVTNARVYRGGERSAGRCKVDAQELRRFRGARMRDTDEVHQCIRTSYLGLISARVQRVAHDHSATRGQRRLAPRPYEPRHRVAAGHERRNERPADVAGSACDEDSVNC